MTTPARLYLLGGFRLEAPGAGPEGYTPVRIESLKGCALLAYLTSLGGTRVSRERLSLLLWSDSDSRRGRQNLRQVLFKLRKTLAAYDLDLLRADEQGVSLVGGDLWVDVWEFDRLMAEGTTAALTRALDLYSGEFLHDLTTDAPVFADWIADKRAQYQTRAGLCTASLLAGQRKDGDILGAIATARRALEIDPCQEEMHREVMSLCFEAGMGGAALNQYRICRAILRRELDVEPDPATEELYRQIQARAATLGPVIPSRERTPGPHASIEAHDALADCEYRYRRGERQAAQEALDHLIEELDADPKDAALDGLRHRAAILRAAIAEASGDPATARDILLVLDRRRGGGGADQEIVLSYALSRTLYATGATEEGMRYARRVLRLAAQSVGSAGPWYLAERLLFRLYLFAPRLDDMIERLKARAGQARQRGDWAAAGEILAAQAMLEGYHGRTAHMEASFELAHTVLARLADLRATVMLLQIEGLTRVWVDDGQNAIDVLDRALTKSKKTGDVIRTCVLRGLRGRAHLPLGRWDAARAALFSAIGLSRSLGHMPYLTAFHAWLAEAEFHGERYRSGLTHAHRAWCLGQVQPRVWNRLPVMRALILANAKAKTPNAEGARWARRQALTIEASLGFGQDSEAVSQAWGGDRGPGRLR